MLVVKRVMMSLVLGLWASWGWAAEPGLRLTTEHLPPYNIVSDDLKQVTGMAGDKIVEMMRRARIRYVLAPSGWNRAYQLALTQADTCVFSTSRLPEREPLFKWVGPVAFSEWWIFTRKDYVTNVKALTDLRGIPISGYRSDAISVWLENMGYQVSDSENYEGSLVSLLTGRVDFWAAGSQSAHELMTRMGALGKVKAQFAFHRLDMFLACNPGVDDNLIRRMRDAHRRMEQDGTLARIDAGYQPQSSSRR
ncbi:substrate-binding periplasmic protein [Parachitinimonas caeni]|uniref:ABC transporter substrate-binding protein n=1 Tax=Parachitinimonas caeni TaxID=3031301 RepID=A0ABT7DZ35_9NEIS|nr:ABC transporter substrate-binding protein [Parachitinimonas caeni]MDK2125329.1 ABC transporter substrate-binding protein [Parachitinimonas caeni]